MNQIMRWAKTYWAYCVLALAVLAPLLRPGYVLTLDMVFTPHLRAPTHVNNNYAFSQALHLLNFVLPSQVMQKLLLLAILLLAGIGMHRLLLYLYGTRTWPQKVGVYFAGIFFMLNPFTYDRLMAGQYLVLLGYSLLPFFVRSLLLFVRTPRWQAALAVALWAVGISIVSIHAVGIMALLAGMALAWALWRRRERKYPGALFRNIGLALAIFVLLSSYWLVPLVLGKGSTAQAVAGFTSGDARAFATVGGSVAGQIANLVRLQGFWAEGHDLYRLPQAHIVGWGALFLVVWLLVLAGGVQLWRRGQRGVAGLGGLCILVGIMLATGVWANWPVAHLPLLAGYREPQKFIMLTVLGYAVLGAAGVTALLEWVQRRTKRKLVLGATSTLLLALPIILTSVMLWGGNGQLRAATYPPSWFAANQLLQRDHGNYQTLFLPWHLYMRFNFAGRIIANPAPAFFDRPMIISDNPELAGAAPVPSTTTVRRLNQLLPRAAQSQTFGATLASLNIKYVVVAQDDDYSRYDYLDHQADLKSIMADDALRVYRNQAYKGD